MIYEPTDRGKQELEIYLADLRKIGNHVVEAVETMGEWRTENGTEKSGTVTDLPAYSDTVYSDTPLTVTLLASPK